jgi:hypothetical protein
MEKIYLEPSSFNLAVDGGIAPQTIVASLCDLGFEPATGLHTIYELSRTFLKSDESSKARGKQLFAFLRDLEPAFQPEVPMLLRAEVDKLRLGTAVLPFLSPLNMVAARHEVARLASGFFDDQARRAVEKTQRRKEESIAAQEAYLVHARSVLETDPAVRALRSFDDVWAYFSARGEIPRAIREALRGAVSSPEAAELAARSASFPAITAVVRANVYLNYLTVTNRSRPGRDKLDDYKHCIEAVYCAALLTGDDQQLRAAGAISPQVKRLAWNDVIKPAGAV